MTVVAMSHGELSRYDTLRRFVAIGSRSLNRSSVAGIGPEAAQCHAARRPDRLSFNATGAAHARSGLVAGTVGRRKTGNPAQPKRGHVTVDRLKPAGLDAIGFMEDAHGLAAVGPAVKLFPCGQMALAAILRIGLEMIEAAPVLEHDNGAQPAHHRFRAQS
jgi:hypothetical protein